MERIIRLLGVLLALCLAPACSVVPKPDPFGPSPAVRQAGAQRISAVVVTDQSELSHWGHRGFPVLHAVQDAEGGSATPIAADGYFLTANHVLNHWVGRHVFVMYGGTSQWLPIKARVVWQSASADLALLHIPEKTPHYYRWTRPDLWLPEGTAVIHGGIATGRQATPGKLSTSLAPQNRFTGSRKVKINIPLQPGDSGGPVTDAYGALIGINSSVEFLVPMETAFFVDSEASRPNTRMIDALLRKDRARNNRPHSGVRPDHD